MKLVSKIPTGRSWGNKLPEIRKGGFVENDVWEGPVEPDETGEYHRCRWLVSGK